MSNNSGVRARRLDHSKGSSLASSASSSTLSLVSKKSPIHTDKLCFPPHRTFFVYEPLPAGRHASLYERLVNLVQLYYYKYLLHTGMYVITPLECFLLNSMALIGSALFWYQALQFLAKFL